MIDPGGIPQYTGDFTKLDKAVSDLRTHASGIRNAGQDVHSRFQATAAYYKAPEAEQLFSSTQPVMDTADEFAGDIESLANALDTFVAEAKPYADRLKQLRLDAIAFVDGVEGDDNWTKDQKKVDKHQALMDGVAAAVEGFQEAERNAANKISAISPAVCRPGWAEDDGTHGTGMYGLSASMLKDAKDLPWGSPEGRSYDRWSLDWWGHGAKHWVWDGIVKDSIWGGFVGLGILEDNLLGINGSDAQHQTWDGLRRTVVGAYAYGMDAAGQGDHLSDWQRGSEAYAKEFGKQFVAYDMWDEDPARAHAVASFNILTAVAGAGGALAKLGKAGRIAETAGTVAKVGDVLDPISGGMKAAKAISNLPKVSEVLANISDRLRLPPTKFPDAVLDLNDRYRVGKDGQLIPINADGTPHLAEAPHEPAAADRIPSLHHGDRELVGVGGHAPEATAGVGDGLPPHASHGSAGEGGGGGSAHDGGAGAHRDGMSERDILREQVDKANHNKPWFKEHYRKNGRRLSAEGTDEFGNDLPQLHATGDPNRPWTADELPVKRAIHHPGEIVGDTKTLDQARHHLLDDSTAKRRRLIDIDMATEKKKLAAQAEYNAHRTPENEAALAEAVKEYKETHTASGEAAEDLGEKAAEFHAVPDHWSNSTRLDDGSRGPYRFDQVWRTPSGRYVVIEAKASPGTRLGERDLGTGRKVQQGTREYFEATLLAMENRGEIDLADELAQALEDGNLDYVEVRANPVGDKYHGYLMKYFNIGKGT